MQGFNLPECCRRSRSRPVTGSYRVSPGPRSGGWGCETGAFSSFCRFCFSPSCRRFHRQDQTRAEAHAHGWLTHTHASAYTLPFSRVLSPLETPLEMNRWMGWWMVRWMDKRADGCSREGWEESFHPSPACPLMDLQDGGWFSLYSSSSSLSLPLAQPHFTSVLWPFSLLLIAITSKWHGRPGECRLPCPVDTLWL